MKILEMKLENFRPFRGKQKIQFADDAKKNITIFLGENGKGKTGIFRALMFGLYGSTHIQQDNSKEVIHLVNLKELNENPKQLINTSVSVLIESKGERFEITRTIVGRKNKNKIEERMTGVKLHRVDKKGNYSPVPIDDDSEVKEIINSILHENIKDFFLFDGEKIDTLAKTDEKEKKEVREAIYKLLQIEDLESAKKYLDELYMNENKSAVRNANDGNITKKRQELEEVKERIEMNNENIRILKQEEENTQELLDKYTLELSHNEEIGRIQVNIRDLNAHLETQKNRLNTENNISLELLKESGPFLLLDDSFQNVENYLDQFTSQRDNYIPINIIDQSLTTGTCACCNNDLNTHLENFEYVKYLKKHYKYSELSEFVTSLKSTITSREQKFETNKQKLANILNNVREIELEIKELKGKIDRKKAEISTKSKDEVDLEKIQISLDQENKTLNEVRSNIAKKINVVENDQLSISKLEKELKEMLDSQEALKFDIKVLETIDSLRKRVQNINVEFSTSMRIKLGETMTNIFQKIIDRKDIDLIESIYINEKFELEIIGTTGIEITQDISQGQRQMVSLAFITALAQVASGDQEKIKFPLFMDSPLNRLSGDNRDRLITHIPNLTSQWILLVTDTELTKQEENVLKDQGRLGKWYRINQIEPYFAEIEEVSVMESISTRGGF